MPLYEYLIITKAGPARPTMLMLHDVISTVLTKHPHVVIREVQNLGDRIMGNPAIRETRTHIIGRYIQILMDAPPAAGLTIGRLLKQKYRYEVFGNNLHRIDDLDYYLNTYFRAKRYISPFNDERDFEYAKRVMEMKNKLDNED